MTTSQPAIEADFFHQIAGQTVPNPNPPSDPWADIPFPEVFDHRAHRASVNPASMSPEEKDLFARDWAQRVDRGRLAEAAEFSTGALNALYSGTFHAPFDGASPDQGMTIEGIKAWQQIADLDERTMASYGPWLYNSPVEHELDPFRHRFTWRWARYLTERGIPAFDAACDGIVAAWDADAARAKTGNLSLPAKDDRAWKDSLILPRRSVFMVDDEPLFTGFQIKPGDVERAAKTDPRTGKRKSLKVLSRWESWNDAHVPARTRWLLGQAGGTRLTKPITIVITEGVGDGMGIAASGIPCITIPGVWMITNTAKASGEAQLDRNGRKIKTLVPTLQALIDTWTANGCLDLIQFLVVFDSDARHNPKVRDAGADAVWNLRKAGAKAELVFSPPTPGVGNGGAGDFLANGATWEDFLSAAHHEPVGKGSAVGVLSGAVVKTADEVDWNDVEDVVSFARANALTPELIPWDRVGGRAAWTMDGSSPLRVSEWWSRTLANRYAITELDSLLYEHNGISFVKSDKSKGMIRAATKFLKVAGALTNAASGPIESEYTEPVLDEDGKPVKDELGVAKVVSKVSQSWPSEHLTQYEDGAKHGHLVRFMTAEPAVSIPDALLDDRGDVLVFENGTYDHSTGAFRENAPEDYQTKWMRCSYSPDATHPVWEQCLDIWGGRGSELERYVQLVIAESFLRRLPSDKKLRFIQGPSDAAKSFMFATLGLCFEDFTSKFPKLLLAGDIAQNSTQFAYAKLGHAALTYCEELDDGSAMHLTTIKDLYSGSKIDARSPGGHWLELKPTWSVWVLVNELPNLIGTIDGSISKRIEVIPAPHRYGTAEEVRRGTHTHIMDQTIESRRNAQIDGIRPAAAAWIVEGLRRLRDEYNDNLYKRDAAPAVVVDATKVYLEGGDQVGRFIQECLQPGKWINSDSDDMRFEATLQDIYERYAEWRKETYSDGARGEMSATTLGNRLEGHLLFADRGITRKQLTPSGQDASGEKKKQRRAFSGVRIAMNGGCGWDGQPVKDPTTREIAAWKAHNRF